MKASYFIKKNGLIIIGFLVFYFFGLHIAGDYGISWDENVRRYAAQSNIKTLADMIGLEDARLDSIPSIDQNFYAYAKPTGMIYGIPAVLIEELFEYDSMRDIFIMRHKLNFSFHFIGIIAFFFFSRIVFKNSNRAIFATLIYSLHPRIFAHGFFNPKDIIFLSIIPVCLLATVHFFQKQNLIQLILLGVTLGIAISCRIVGVYLPFLVVIIFFCYKVFNFRKTSKPYLISVINNSLMIIILSFVTAFIFIPYFWGNPIQNFIDTFTAAKNFSWSGDNFYLGKYISARSVPWHYIFTWFSITTPIIFLIFLLIGFVLMVKDIKQRLWNNYIIYFCFFGICIPLISAILFKSTLYDGWRHFYFTYAFISTIISYGAFRFYNFIQVNNKLFLKAGFVFIFFFGPIKEIIQMHPYQQTFFNFLAGENPMLNFEGDYWGTSYRSGLEYILKHDSNDSIFISVANVPGSLNRHILPDFDKKRLVYDFMSKGNNKPDYYLTNFRGSVSDYIKSNKKEKPFDNEVYSINVGGMKILGVYKVL